MGMGEIVGARIIPRLRGGGTVKAEIDRDSHVVFWLGISVSVVIAVLLGRNGVTLLPDLFFYLGIVFMLVGVAFRQWAILVLGRFFSTTVKILTDHRIVTNGPYRVIRHPAHTGVLLTVMGLGLAFRTWGGTLLILVVVGLTLNYRIRVEEKALKAEFGNEYIAYAKRTKRLIPFLL